MKNLKTFFLFAVLSFTLIAVFQTTAVDYSVSAATHKPVARRVVRSRVVHRVAPVPTGSPVAKLTYNARSHRFYLTVTNVKQLNYTIAYNKKGSDIMEALQGARRYKKGTTFSINVYAGSQSTKYFIPHTVTGGTLEIHGTDGQGQSFTINQTFTVSGGKLTITS